jgi:hypothetical protein
MGDVGARHGLLASAVGVDREGEDDGGEGDGRASRHG